MLVKTHTLKTRLEHGDCDVFGYWAYDPSNTAIIFVHGFNGDAVNTWLNFPTLLTSTTEFANCDIFYYGYDSLFQQINHSAAQLYEFIVRLREYNDVYYDETIGRYLKFKSNRFAKYEKIVIIGHSLGAVVARRALIHATKLQAPWCDQIKLILVAPAHNGARVLRLFFSSLPTAINILLAVIMHKFVTIEELKSDSTTLKVLAEDCNRYIKLDKKTYLTASEVISASHDYIVTNLDFCDDPPPIPMRGSHTSICKPESVSERIIKILAKHVQ